VLHPRPYVTSSVSGVTHTVINRHLRQLPAKGVPGQRPVVMPTWGIHAVLPELLDSFVPRSQRPQRQRKGRTASGSSSGAPPTATRGAAGKNTLPMSEFGQEQPYSEVTDSSRSLAQSTRSRHTRRFETVISTDWHSRFLLRGLSGVRMEGGARYRAR
jgi:hypothetical protein